jgi:predicted GIY-YIG superfamily endonuclease
MPSGVYEYRCKVTGRVYRGSAVDLDARHIKHVNAKGDAGLRLRNEWYDA